MGRQRERKLAKGVEIATTIMWNRRWQVSDTRHATRIALIGSSLFFCEVRTHTACNHGKEMPSTTITARVKSDMKMIIDTIENTPIDGKTWEKLSCVRPPLRCASLRGTVSLKNYSISNSVLHIKNSL